MAPPLAERRLIPYPLPKALAVVAALKYPLAGLGICICCLLVHLKTDPLGIYRDKAKIGERMGWARDHDND